MCHGTFGTMVNPALYAYTDQNTTHIAQNHPIFILEGSILSLNHTIIHPLSPTDSAILICHWYAHCPNSDKEPNSHNRNHQFTPTECQ